ncbi:zinc finger protein ZAT3-like [Cornus florida]|uniref:zinc finger protein ZAT3-like n=1 Tax=Cornus florida TaxID=4283 RepID=UPI00289CB89E|nr:zinc finger protein ZAT3-like [Cornus florida]
MNDNDEITGFRLSPLAGEASQSVTGGNFPAAVKNHHNPRKRRTKLMRIDHNPVGLSSIGGGSKPKYGKKPDPGAPKITRPCSECGKKFWSWKALFGHMRCHPERQWRGINPPPNFRRPNSPETTRDDPVETEMLTEEDHEVASCLLMLANGGGTFETPSGPSVTNTITSTANLGNLDYETGFRDAAMGGDGYGDGAGTGGSSAPNCRFECSSCKKVFGSHQALGGHRASHKNVKGCFAITRCDSEDVEHNAGHVDERNGEGEVKECGEEKMVMVLGHRCSICLRVFPSGQALGGHKRCHWEKGDEPSSSFATRGEGCGLDLNLPAPIEDHSSCSYSSGLALDLRLGL